MQGKGTGKTIDESGTLTNGDDEHAVVRQLGVEGQGSGLGAAALQRSNQAQRCTFVSQASRQSWPSALQRYESMLQGMGGCWVMHEARRSCMHPLLSIRKLNPAFDSV